MSISKAERYQIENEMLFRRMNEKVGDDLGALDAEYIEKNEEFLVRDERLLIKFKCECSNEHCNTRIAMTLNDYQDIHKDRDTFVVTPNHQVDPIEKVIYLSPEYNIVAKNNSTRDPKKGQRLRNTAADNSETK